MGWPGFLRARAKPAGNLWAGLTGIVKISGSGFEFHALGLIRAEYSYRNAGIWDGFGLNSAQKCIPDFGVNLFVSISALNLGPNQYEKLERANSLGLGRVFGHLPNVGLGPIRAGDFALRASGFRLSPDPSLLNDTQEMT